MYVCMYVCMYMCLCVHVFVYLFITINSAYILVYFYFNYILANHNVTIWNALVKATFKIKSHDH